MYVLFLKICWKVNLDPLEALKLACFTLPVSKHRWLTTISILPHPSPHSTHPFSWVLCGDRKGSLHLYQLTPSDLQSSGPCQTLAGVHGPNDVTYSCIHENFIYTCGRNGLCRKFQLENGKLVELTTFKVSTLQQLKKLMCIKLSCILASERIGLDRQDTFYS